jgi:hypothetical protein
MFLNLGCRMSIENRLAENHTKLDSDFIHCTTKRAVANFLAHD